MRTRERKALVVELLREHGGDCRPVAEATGYSVASVRRIANVYGIPSYSTDRRKPWRKCRCH